MNELGTQNKKLADLFNSTTFHDCWSINLEGELAERFYWISLIGIGVIFLWSFLLTHELIKITSNKYNLNTTLYYINTPLFFIVYFTVMYLNKGEEYNFTGIYALLGFYVFYAFLQSYGFAGRIIKSAELDRKSRKRESIGYFLLLIFLPIGIWVLQPKINRLFNQAT